MKKKSQAQRKSTTYRKSVKNEAPSTLVSYVVRGKVVARKVTIYGAFGTKFSRFTTRDSASKRDQETGCFEGAGDLVPGRGKKRN
jgi:hypothetical protein